MKAEEIREGDQFLSPEGDVFYTVEEVSTQRPHVIAIVRFSDGGNGQRMWEIGKEAPLTRPA